MVDWGLQDSLKQTELAIDEFLANFPHKLLGRVLRFVILPLGRVRKAPSDEDQGIYIVAEDLVKRVLGKEAVVLETFKGSDLIGLQYTPLFEDFADRALLPENEGTFTCG